MRLCPTHAAHLEAALHTEGVAALQREVEVTCSFDPRKQSFTAAVALPSNGLLIRPRSRAFDPLEAALVVIGVNALKATHGHAGEPNDDGSERCPVCFLLLTCDCGETATCAWSKLVPLAARSTRKMAEQIGLLRGSREVN